jgi:hypothetical protein
MLRSIVVCILALSGCAPAQGSEPTAGYELTIRNTNPGQNFSPPVIVLHTPEYRLFDLDQPATEALWRLAEDGSTAEFQALADPASARSWLVARSIAAIRRHSRLRSRRQAAF